MRTVDAFLDVDGVINANHYTTQPRGSGWPEFVTLFASGLQVLYAPALVDRLNALAARPWVRMHWLTTWEDDAPNDLSPAIGLDGRGWDVIGTEQHYSKELTPSGGWWKHHALRDWMDTHEHDEILWVDDDIPFDPETQAWLPHHPEVHAIAPQAMRGLSRQQMDLIDEIAARPRR